MKKLLAIGALALAAFAAEEVVQKPKDVPKDAATLQKEVDALKAEVGELKAQVERARIDAADRENLILSYRQVAVDCRAATGWKPAPQIVNVPTKP